MTWAVKDDMETDRETLGPVTLDIVFRILMAFTGVSGWTVGEQQLA